MEINHYKGDTFKEYPFTISKNGAPLNLTNAVIKMQLKKEFKGASFLTLQSGSGITITNPTAGEFKINEQIIDIEAYNYLYDLQIKLADNTVKTYIKGYFNIIQDVTTT